MTLPGSPHSCESPARHLVTKPAKSERKRGECERKKEIADVPRYRSPRIINWLDAKSILEIDVDGEIDRAN